MSSSPQSRKRPFEGENNNYGFKRFNANTGRPVLKLLVKNFVAGKLIGKGGSNLNELQTKFSLSIKISPSKEFYPGTNDRIVCIFGDIENIIRFGVYLIEDFKGDMDTEPTDIKLLISNDAAGLVIGRGGAQIKSIKSESNVSRIAMDRKDENMTGERVLTVSGEKEQVEVAFQLIMETVAGAGDKISTTNIKYPAYNEGLPTQDVSLGFSHHPSMNSHFISNDGGYGLASALTAPIAPTTSIASMFGNPLYQPQTDYKVKFYAEMEIPDHLVGTILGKSGKTALDINRNSGAKLQFSKKDEFVEGTQNRLLTITGGSSLQVQNAYSMVDGTLARMETEYRGY